MKSNSNQNKEVRDGLFEDIRNYISILQMQIKMGKIPAALDSLSRMNLDMAEWEKRLHNGETWKVWPESMKTSAVLGEPRKIKKA